MQSKVRRYRQSVKAAAGAMAPDVEREAEEAERWLLEAPLRQDSCRLGFSGKLNLTRRAEEQEQGAREARKAAREAREQALDEAGPSRAEVSIKSRPLILPVRKRDV